MSDEGRLRWRCRRGMRELDQLLGGWLDARYAQADESARAAFADLLEQPDPELWRWLQGDGASSDARFRRIIDEIRTRDRV
ncbi:MAG: succinate dehydrogenase assembly factor 2 [Proteobacteria bacterium]|nr:succinate dehydrogenase assembly factor 2 [Pseudomonadota bacterium]MBS0567471.1 succinate dehydrogenase assembly factor 2 [Pseudomonadota bacterium]